MTYKHLTEKDVLRIQDEMPNIDDTKKVVDLFKLFGDQTRLNILLSISNEELCVHDICKVVDMSQSAVSHQLRNLREAKLLKDIF